MAGFEAISGVCKVEMLGHDTVEERPIVNVLHADCGTTPSAAYLTQIANQLNGAFYANRGAFPDTYILDEIRVTDLNTVTGPQVTIPVNTAGSGGDGVPAQCCVVELYTPLRGRSYTGRIFLPIAQTEVTTGSGAVTSTEITNVSAFITAIQTNWAGLTPASSLVVASRKKDLALVVTSFVIRNLVGWIRRRLFG